MYLTKNITLHSVHINVERTEVLSNISLHVAVANCRAPGNSKLSDSCIKYDENDLFPNSSGIPHFTRFSMLVK